ncbi:MAG: hypothetical protein AAF570_01725 [Bacteroidota bacterium]
MLNAQERADLRKIQRNAVLRAALAGALSAGIAVLVGVLLEPMLGEDPSDPPSDKYWLYLGAVTGVSIIATLNEIAFLYWDALRSVHALSAKAGLDLFPEQEESSAVATALVRAALELPNPPDDLEGVNPQREVSKARLLIGTLVYKLKATASNFLIKALVRRVVGRSGFRAWMEITAVPVYAVWNAIICYWVLRQARIRAMGPSAVVEFTHHIFEDQQNMSREAQLEAFRAVGASIVRTVDLHPNLIALMRTLESRFGDPGEVIIDNSELFLKNLTKVPPDEQDAVLRMLALASIIDGKFQRRERILMRKALTVCGYEEDLTGVRAWRKAFVRGYDIPAKLVIQCLPPKVAESGHS